MQSWPSTRRHRNTKPIRNTLKTSKQSTRSRQKVSYFEAASTRDYSILTCLEGKRSKLDTETSTSTRAGSNEQNDQAANRRSSLTQADTNGVALLKSDPNLSVGLSRLHSGSTYASKPTSPTNRSLSGFNSPRSGEQFSPISASPRSAVIPRDGVFEPPANNSIRDPRLPFDSNPYQPPPFNQDHNHQSSSSSTPPPPPYPYPSHYSTSADYHSRRTARDATRLPPLSHEDTTLSSESSHSGQGMLTPSYPEQALPADPSKSMRMLPQPIPSIGPSPSPLDRPMAHVTASHYPHHSNDYRTQGPLAVLVRAGELAARVADEVTADSAASP